jgi:hypothetical protein
MAMVSVGTQSRAIYKFSSLWVAVLLPRLRPADVKKFEPDSISPLGRDPHLP